jgi:TPR repeat protein
VLPLLQAAADKGDREAMARVAQIYDTGMIFGAKRDPDKATAIYRKLAELGDANAESALAMRYDMGISVPEDKAQALSWYQKAAEQGDMMSQMNLARRYEEGEDVPKDEAKAFYWNRKLADQGDADAERKVAMGYAGGKGVAQDYLQAYVWLNIVILSSTRDSGAADTDKMAMESLATHLTAAQKAEAKRLIDAWKARNDAG